LSVCSPSCDIDNCGSGTCSVTLSRRWWTDGLSESFNSSNGYDEYDEVTAALGKRIFTMTAGSSTYGGTDDPLLLPTRREVNTYLPAVFNGGENGNYGTAQALTTFDGELAS
jgi:hypothetical protein